MLTELLKKYLAIFPEERAKLQLLLEQIDDTERDLNDRKNFRGHITAGGLVLSPDRTKLLLVHHKIFKRWFQPAGHWDADDSDPLAAARREIAEETAVCLARSLSIVLDNQLVPIDIDTHAIPANEHKQEAAHFHHDFRYVFVANSENLHYQAKEVMAADWFAFKDPHTKELTGVIAKLRRFNFI